MKFYTYIHTRADDLKVFYVGKGTARDNRAKQSAAVKGVPKPAGHAAKVHAARMANGGYKKGPEAALKAWATKRAKAAAKALLCQE